MSEINVGNFMPVQFQNGLTLASVNTEARCLLLGNTATVGGRANIPKLHIELINNGADGLHPYQMTHTRDAIRRTPSEAFQVRERNEIELSELGFQAAGLGGILLRDYAASADTTGPINAMVGYNKLTQGQTVLPAPFVRLMIMRVLRHAGRHGKPIGDVVELFADMHLTEKTIRKHIESLEQSGNIENLGGRLAQRRMTKKGSSNIPTYLDIVDEFFETPEQLANVGIDYVASLLRNRQKHIVALFIKRSILGSGKNGSPACEVINRDVAYIFDSLPAHHGLTTTELAALLDTEPKKLGIYLMRIVKSFGTRAALTESARRASGNERIWLPNHSSIHLASS